MLIAFSYESYTALPLSKRKKKDAFVSNLFIKYGIEVTINTSILYIREV